MRAMLSLSPLLASVLLVQLGVGVLGPLDALAAADLDNFSTRDIGLIGSAHFLGFLVGCVTAPGIMARAGHSRAFAAMAAIGVIGTLMHPVFETPEIWMALRFAGGFTMAGAYTVIESC